jgi:hypothetical protein
MQARLTDHQDNEPDVGRWDFTWHISTLKHKIRFTFAQYRAKVAACSPEKPAISIWQMAISKGHERSTGFEAEKRE